MKYFSLLLFVVFIGIYNVAESKPSELNDFKNIELRRYQAMVNKEFDLLDTMLSEKLIFIHANGSTDTKESFLKRLKNENLVYKSIAPKDLKVQFYETSFIVTGKTDIEIFVPNRGDVELSLWFTTVYAKHDNKWQVVSYQSTNRPKT